MALVTLVLSFHLFDLNNMRGGMSFPPVTLRILLKTNLPTLPFAPSMVLSFPYSKLFITTDLRSSHPELTNHSCRTTLFSALA